MRKALICRLLILILLLLPPVAFSEIITGKVTKVVDGDTITILTNKNKQVKIRRYGLDTPRKITAYGKVGKKFTASLTARKQASVKVYDTDKYKRSVGVVHVGKLLVLKC